MWFCHLNKGQIMFFLVSLILIFFIFLVIILSNTTNTFFQFNNVFQKFISLKSLLISGLRYSLYQINQNPSFTTTSASLIMPQGVVIYSVSDYNTTTKIININASLNSFNLSRILTATATINASGTIINLDVKEE
jgi:uncharacterized membrane protein YjjP (DUF1212 family)